MGQSEKSRVSLLSWLKPQRQTKLSLNVSELAARITSHAMSTTEFGQIDDPLEAVLFPFSHQATVRLAQTGRRLAHYTSAEVAFSIIKNREVWMRNAQTMNDYSEIAHGRACLEAAAERGFLPKLGQAVDAIVPGTFKRALEMFDGWSAALQHNTFLTCVSEHLGAEDDEDSLGRLSMWRAYGGENGVALILNPSFLDNADMGSVVTSPVHYANSDKFCEEVARVTANIEAAAERLAPLADMLADNIFNVMRYALLCTKHPGFREEREWRVIYTPHIEASPYVTEDMAVVRGVPQVIQKIKLINDPENGIKGIAPDDLIEAILIGPTQFPMTFIETFHKLLREAGVARPQDRIRVSNIPLRR